MLPAQAQETADLTGIKQVSEVPMQQVQVYSVPIYRTMILKDGTQADVLINTINITKSQLQQAIVQAQAQIDDAQSKLDAIVALEAQSISPVTKA